MEVDIGTEEDDMHAKEYALALQRVVLENADEIFTACKEYDRENHGILSTEVFCNTVSSVLGVPYEDIMILISGEMLTRDKIPYASWLMKLQQNNALLSPQRQSYNYNNQFNIEELLEEELLPAPEHSQNESHDSIYTSIFEDNNFSDNEDSNEGMVSSSFNTKNNNNSNNNNRSRVHVRRSGSVYIDLQDNANNSSSNNNNNNDNNNSRIMSLSRQQQRSRIVEHEKNVYDDLWDDISQNQDFREKLERLEFTLRLERDGQASHAQTAEAVGKVMEATQQQLFHKMSKTQREATILKTEKLEIAQELENTTSELANVRTQLNATKKEQEALIQQFNSAKGAIGMLQESGNELLAAANERQKALAQLKKSHGSTQSKTTTISQGIDGIVGRIQQLATELTNTQKIMRDTIRKSGAVQVMSHARSLEKLKMIRSLNKWKLKVAKMAGVEARRRLKEKMKHAEQRNGDLESNVMNILKKKSQYESVHVISRILTNWARRNVQKLFLTWQHNAGLSALAVRKTFKNSVNELVQQNNTVLKERNEIAKQFTETKDILKREIQSQKKRYEDILEMSLELQKKLEREQMETNRWRDAHKAYQLEIQKKIKESEKEIMDVKNKNHVLVEENGNLDARLAAIEEHAAILEKALKHEQETNKKKIELLIQKTARQIEAEKRKRLSSRHRNGESDNAEQSTYPAYMGSRGEIIKAYDAAAAAAYETKIKTETFRAQQKLDLIQRETNELLQTQEMLKEEMSLLRQEKLEVDRIEGNEREEFRAEIQSLRMKLDTGEKERKKLQIGALGMKREVAEARALAELKMMETDDHRKTIAKDARLLQVQRNKLSRLQMRAKIFKLGEEGGTAYFNSLCIALFLKQVVESWRIRMMARAMGVFKLNMLRATKDIHVMEGKRDNARRVLKRWKNEIFLKAWRTWTRFVGMDLKEKHKVNTGTNAAIRVLQRWENKNKLKAWRVWMTYVNRSIRNDERIRHGSRSARRVLKRMENRNLLIGWRQWLSFCRISTKLNAERERARKIAGRVMLRVENKQLMMGWRAWLVFAKWKKEKEISVRIAKRVLMRLLNQKMYFAFSTWHRKAIVESIRLQHLKSIEETEQKHRQYRQESEEKYGIFRKQSMSQINELEERKKKELLSLHSKHMQEKKSIVRTHEELRKRLCARLIVKVWAIRHHTLRNEKKMSAFSSWKNTTWSTNRSSLLGQISQTQRQVSAVLTYRGMMRYVKKKMRKYFGRWHTIAREISEKEERVRRTYRYYLTKIDNSVLNRGFQTWRMNCLLVRQFVENARLGAQKLNKIFDAHAVRGLHSGFRQLVYYSMYVRQQRMKFGMAQKFIVNKVRQYMDKRMAHAFRKWFSKVNKLRQHDGRKRRKCTYLYMKMEEGLQRVKTRKFRYWVNVTRGLKIQALRVHSATKYIVNCIRNYIKGRLSDGFAHWCEVSRILMEERIKRDAAVRFCVVQIQRHYKKRLNTAFVQWFNANQFLGIKNKEVSSAVKFVVVSIKRHIKKKMMVWFLRWVDRTRDEADFAVRHAEATRFIVNAVRKHIQGKIAKSFRQWDRFRLTSILEEQRKASNNAALELQRQNHENMVAARFIAMIVSKEKAAYQSAWAKWTKFCHFSRVAEVEGKLRKEMESVTQSHQENLAKVTELHEQSMKDMELAARKARVVGLLSKLEDGNTRLMMSRGIAAFKIHVQRYNGRRSRAFLILSKSSEKWRMSSLNNAFDVWGAEIIKEKTLKMKARYVMNTMLRSWRMQMVASLNQWRKNAELKGFKHNMQIVHAKNMFTKVLLRINRQKRRAYDKWLHFVDMEEEAARRNQTKEDGLIQMSSLEDQFKNEMEELQQKYAEERKRAEEEKQKMEEEKKMLKSEKSLVEMEKKKAQEQFNIENGTLQQQFEAAMAKANLLKAHLLLTAIIRSYRKKMMLRGYLRWWFATKAIQSEELRKRLEVAHSKKVETLADEHKMMEEKMLKERSTLESDYTNRFRQTKKRQIGQTVIRCINVNIRSRLMKGMNRWKLFTNHLKKKSGNYVVGTRVLDKVILSLKRRRKFAAFMRFRRFVHFDKQNEFKNQIGLKRSFNLIKTCFQRYDQSRLARGWKKWVDYNATVIKNREGQLYSIKSIFSILEGWRKKQLFQAVKKWHIMCEKRKFHALVISKMLLPLRRKSKMLVAKAFVRWVTVSLTHPTYRWAQAGRELAIKMHHLSMVWKRNKVSQAFRAWTTHTHLIHHLILEKNFTMKIDSRFAEAAALQKIHSQKAKIIAARQFDRVFKLLNKKIEKSYFEHWKFLRIRAQDEEIFLRRIAMKLGKKAIAAAMRKWKGLVKEINSLNYRGSLIKRVIGHIAKEKLHFYWYKFKRICRRYKQLEMEEKVHDELEEEKIKIRFSHITLKLMKIKLYNGYHKWKEMWQTASSHQTAIKTLERLFVRDLKSARRSYFHKWARITVEENYKEILKAHVQRTGNKLVELRAQKLKAVYGWRWSRNILRKNKEQWEQKEQENKGYLEKMESTVVALKSEHEEEAVWSEAMTREIKTLQQRMVMVQSKQIEEMKTSDSKRRKEATIFLFRVMHRYLVQRKKYRAFRIWREGLILSRHEQLADRLLKKQKKSDIAVKRITALVNKAQRDHQKTEMLLSDIKERAQAIRRSARGRTKSPTMTRRGGRSKKSKGMKSKKKKGVKTVSAIRSSSGGVIRLHRTGSVEINIPNFERNISARGTIKDTKRLSSPFGTPSIHAHNTSLSPENTYGRSTVSSRNRSLSPARRANKITNIQRDPQGNSESVPWISPGVGETHWHPPENASFTKKNDDENMDDDTYDMEFSSTSTKKAPVYLFENV